MHDARAKLGDVVTSELLQSQIEIASPILHSHDEAREVMFAHAPRVERGRCRAWLADRCRQHASAGHLAGPTVTEKRRYDKLMSDFRIISQRNLVCGLHIHVGIPEGVDRVEVMNRAMHWLPAVSGAEHLVAVLESSRHRPAELSAGAVRRVASQRHSGFLSGRGRLPGIRRSHAGCGRDQLTPLTCGGRFAQRCDFPTLELRISDVCTRLEDALAIAALYRCLIATLLANPEMGKARSTHTRRLIDENRWRAKRDGIKAEFILETSNEVVPVADRRGDLMTRCARADRSLELRRRARSRSIAFSPKARARISS